MIHLSEEFSAHDAAMEAHLERFQHRTKKLDGWLREARLCLKCGDSAGVKEAMLAIAEEFSRLVDEKVIQ